MNFLKNILLFIPELNTYTQNIIANIFSITEFVFLVLIFKNYLAGRFRNIANIMFCGFFCAVVTVYIIKGFECRFFLIEELSDATIIFISVLCITKLSTSSNIHIFDQPLFWIATGSLFYFSILILLQSFSLYDVKKFQGNLGVFILYTLINIIRYLFYLFATIFYIPDAHS